MAKFSMQDLLNSQSKNKQDEDEFIIKRIPIEKIKQSEENFYGIRGIEELAANIEMFGLMHNLTVKDADSSGMYEIISGERRYQACKMLYDAGNKRFATLPCNVRAATQSKEESELELIFANADTRTLTDYEKTCQAARIKQLLQQMKKNGYPFKGRMREIVAGIMEVSPAQVGIMESIDKNLSQGFKEEFKAGNIGITQAHKLAGKSQEEQAEILDKYREEGAEAISSKKPRPEKADQPKPKENKNPVAAESQPANDNSRLEIKTREDAINALESLADRIERQSPIGQNEMARTIRAAVEFLR